MVKELAPPRLERKENPISVTKETKVLSPAFSEGKKKKAFAVRTVGVRPLRDRPDRVWRLSG